MTAKEIRASSGRQLAEVIATGKALLRVKEVLLHGEFGEWLAAALAQLIHARCAAAFGAQSCPRADEGTIFSIIRTDRKERQRAEHERRKAEAKARRAAMTPEERKREDQARKRRNARGASWAAKLERERLAFERKKRAAEVATQEAASLIFEYMADEIGRLIGLLEKGGAWRLSDALKELQKGARS